MWDDVAKHLVGTPIMLDTCFSLHLMDKKTASDMIRSHGADKVLFGTDWPWYSQKKTYEHLLALDLTDDEKMQISATNARKILGI